jgi:hypothetical protein
MSVISNGRSAASCSLDGTIRTVHVSPLLSIVPCAVCGGACACAMSLPAPAIISPRSVRVVGSRQATMYRRLLGPHRLGELDRPRCQPARPRLRGQRLLRHVRTTYAYLTHTHTHPSHRGA